MLVLLAAAVCGLLLGAGVVKVARLGEFRREIEAYDLVPARLLGLAAVAIPVAEVAAGLLPFVTDFAAISMLPAICLLVIFSAALARNLVTGRTAISCACFGRSDQTLHWGMPMRNALMIGVLLAAIAIDLEARVTVAALGAAVPALALGVLTVEYVRMIDLVRRSA